MCAKVGNIWHTMDGQCYDEMNRNLWMVLLNAIMQTEEDSWPVMPVSGTRATPEGDDDEARPDDDSKIDSKDGVIAEAEANGMIADVEADDSSGVTNREDGDSVGVTLDPSTLQEDEVMGAGSEDTSATTDEDSNSKVPLLEGAETGEAK